MENLNASPCPACGYVLDGATGLTAPDGAKPKPGDVSLCIYCGELLEFDAKLQFARGPKFEELGARGLAPAEVAQLRQLQKLARSGKLAELAKKR